MYYSGHPYNTIDSTPVNTRAPTQSQLDDQLEAVQLLKPLSQTSEPEGTVYELFTVLI